MQQTSVVIFGGGVAGLWTLCKLRRAGFSAALFEAGSLGGTQTLSSQGIIHSGMKYTLDGVTSGQPSILSEMLPIWADCLEGRGEIDLGQTELRSPSTYFWSTGFSLGGLVAPMMLKSKVVPIKERSQHPEVLQTTKFSGRVSRIEEQVLDVKSLIRNLQGSAEGAIFQGKFAGVASRGRQDRVESARVELGSGEQVEIRADAFVFCGGEGNEQAGRLLGFGEPIGQVRPLGMIIVDPAPGELFGHCIVTSKRPRATITTHASAKGKVWYVGGGIAEEAARLSDADAAGWARKELEEMFPWIEWKGREYRVHRVNRAEPKQTALVLPEGPRLRSEGNVALAWPTKLVLAPALAGEVQKWLKTLELPARAPGALNLPAPALGKYPWE